MAIAARIEAASTMADEATSAFERLFHAEYAKVAGIARRILADAHAAEDVAQDVFVSFHRLHPADAPYGPKWLYAAAAHTALNAVRGRKRRERREFAEATNSALRINSDVDPSETVAAVERRLEVRRALGRIRERYAMVLAMRYAGLSYAEVADALGASPNQVGTMLRRAEAALKKELRYDPS